MSNLCKGVSNKHFRTFNISTCQEAEYEGGAPNIGKYFLTFLDEIMQKDTLKTPLPRMMEIPSLYHLFFFLT